MTNSKHYPEVTAEKINKAFGKLTKSLEGLQPHEALEALAKVSGRLVAGAYRDREDREKAYICFGDAVGKHIVSFAPYADAYYIFKETTPNSDTIKN